MPRDLFGNVTRPFAGVGARSRWTVPISLAAHTFAVVAVVVVPLVATDALPALSTRISFEIVTPLVPPEPPRPKIARPPDAPAVNPDAAPTVAPDGIAKEPDVAPEPFEGNDSGSDVIVGIASGGLGDMAPPPPPPQPERPRTVRAGVGVKQPVKVHDVSPAYPAIAQSARVQGVVIIQATIGVDGQVIDATVLRSVPLLDQAALEAVRQWRYTPSQLNGVPVAVVMTVTVNFTLR